MVLRFQSNEKNVGLKISTTGAVLLNTYRYAKNKSVTERLYSKIATFEWPFSRTLRVAIKASLTPKDAQFCQVHFLMAIFALKLFSDTFIFSISVHSKAEIITEIAKTIEFLRKCSL